MRRKSDQRLLELIGDSQKNEKEIKVPRLGRLVTKQLEKLVASDPVHKRLEELLDNGAIQRHNEEGTFNIEVQRLGKQEGENIVSIKVGAQYYNIKREELTRPTRFSESQLAYAGVKITTASDGIWLKCAFCGQTWSRDSHSGVRRRRLLHGYWKCPNGCNKHAK